MAIQTTQDGTYSADDVKIAAEKVTGNTFNETTGIIVSASGNEIDLSDLLKDATSGNKLGWNEEKGANEPDLSGGLIPITYNSDGSVNIVTDPDSSDWYSYTTSDKRWANAVTGYYDNDNLVITGYWVWIPRYAYQITSNLGVGGSTSTSGTVEIKFLQGTTNQDSSGKVISTTYPTVTDNTMDDYVVHPVFTDGSSNNYMNGEWDEEITGFWVAKYPAGYQANTITDGTTLSTTLANDTDTIQYSSVKYTSVSATTVPIGTISTSTAISYPVFLPLTYAYNYISTDDAYTLSKQIATATDFYGLTNTDSHQMKNSEWGAVAYLTQSSYGRSQTEVNINNYYTEEASPWRTAVTGVYANGTTTDSTTDITAVYAYYTETGLKGSSTGTIYGIYDLNGCVWERTAGYISNGVSNLSYGKSYATTTANETGYLTLSTKYVTVYPYNSSDDTYENNYTLYKSLQLQSGTYGFGDAILETSASGTGATSWYADYSYFAGSTNPFFNRGGYYGDSSNAGTFYFSFASGSPFYRSGFRAVLVSK